MRTREGLSNMSPARGPPLRRDLRRDSAHTCRANRIEALPAPQTSHRSSETHVYRFTAIEFRDDQSLLWTSLDGDDHLHVAVARAAEVIADRDETSDLVGRDRHFRRAIGREIELDLEIPLI